MNKGIIAVVIGVLAVLALVSTTVFTRAQENVINRTIRLDQGVGRVFDQDLDYGDRLVLTLNNPTDQALVFETRYPLLGDRRSWVVPANGQEVVTFEYRQAFADDLTYVVRPQVGGPEVAQGTLVPRDRMGETPTAEGQAAVREQPAEEAFTAETPAGEEPGMMEEDVVERGATVRGYW